MSKKFTLAGTSTLKGVNTYRFATGNVKVRTGVLKRNGHSDIKLLELPQAMTKEDATAWLSGQGITAHMPTGHRKTDNPKKVREDKPASEPKKAAAPKKETKKEAPKQEAPKVDEAAAKLAAKRAKDAERKRAKRAAEKAAKQAEAQA